MEPVFDSNYDVEAILGQYDIFNVNLLPGARKIEFDLAPFELLLRRQAVEAASNFFVLEGHSSSSVAGSSYCGRDPV